MSNTWIFSPSSEVQLRRCISAAQPQDSSNKWIREFKLKHTNNNFGDNNIKNNTKEDQEATELVIVSSGEEMPVSPLIYEASEKSEIQNDLFDSLEAEPIARFDFMVEECIKNPKLLIKLAERLSGSTIEKLCNHLFNKQDVYPTFLEYFYLDFFPTYLKREHSWFTLDLLVKADKAYPSQFKGLLHFLLEDLEISSKVLHDFLLTLNEEKKSLFMLTIAETHLSSEQFVYHLLTIYTAYKDSKKNDIIQDYIASCLINHSQTCINDRHYGRLLLAYIQAQNGLGKLINDFTKMEKVIELHSTPFKKPCLTALKENLEKYN